MILKDMKTVDGRIISLRVTNGSVTVVDSWNQDEEIYDGHGIDYVSEGWIDMHTHCFNKFELYGDEIDKVGVESGVCTVVDAGTVGANTVDEFASQRAGAKTRTYLWLNISDIGIERQDELAQLEHINFSKIRNAFGKYAEMIVGLKVRMSHSVVKNNGDYPLQLGLDIANELNLPLMIHIGNPPSCIEMVMRLARKNDIITHVLNPKENGIFDQDGKLKPEVLAAHERGVWFDLGHGTDSFSYDVARSALAQGLKVDSISSDIYFRNRLNGPVYCLGDVMSKMLAVGYRLAEVIDLVTKKPRQALHLPDYIDDLTIFRINETPVEIADSTGSRCVLPKHIEAVGTIVNGRLVWKRED